MRLHPRVVPPVVVALAAGCAAGADSDLATRSDSVGVELVVNVAQDRPLTLDMTRSFALGGEDSGPESFYRLYPRGVSVSAAGEIAILDSQTQRVVLFDASGEHLRTLGRQGAGPGELEMGSSLVAMPDGAVSVYDYRKRALVRFGPAAEVLDQQALPVPTNGQEMVATASGLLLLSQNAPRGSGALVRRVMHVGGGEPTRLGDDAASEVRAVRYESCGVVISLPALFATELVWDSDGWRTVIASGAAYSIDVFDGLEHVATVRRGLEPELVTDAVIARHLGEGERWGVGGREWVKSRSVCKRRSGAPHTWARLPVPPPGGRGGTGRGIGGRPRWWSS